jgi:hypothetical protein
LSSLSARKEIEFRFNEIKSTPLLKMKASFLVAISCALVQTSFGLRFPSASMRQTSKLQSSLVEPSSATPIELPDDATLEGILNVAKVAAQNAGILIRDNIGARVKYSKTNYKVTDKNES